MMMMMLLMLTTTTEPRAAGSAGESMRGGASGQRVNRGWQQKASRQPGRREGDKGVRTTMVECYTFSLSYRAVVVHDSLVAHAAREVVAVLPQLLQQLGAR